MFPYSKMIEVECMHVCSSCAHFLCRYTMILRDKNHTADERKKCADLLMKYDVTKKEWQLGKTKVRLRDQHMFTHIV